MTYYPLVAFHYRPIPFWLNLLNLSRMSASGYSISRSDPLDVSSVPTADVLGYEDTRRKREELRNARRPNDDENDREFRRLMRKYNDIASQNDIRSLKMEYVGLRESARSMAEASKNYGKKVSRRISKRKLRSWQK